MCISDPAAYINTKNNQLSGTCARYGDDRLHAGDENRTAMTRKAVDSFNFKESPCAKRNSLNSKMRQKTIPVQFIRQDSSQN